jgi:raffinose/stachyose/melibiose transport system substrate-binding protein
MIKRVSWIALIVLLVASMALSACAQSAPPAAPTQPPAAAPTQPAAAAPTQPPAAAPTQPPAAAATQPPAAAGGPVTLTLGNWRPDDVKQMQVILDAFHAANPNITVKFDPTNPPDYDAAVRTQMEAGTGDDLYYLRAKDSGASHKLYDEGHFVAIDGLPGLDNIIPAAIETWTASDGKVFGVGYIATSEGIYYNKDVFTKLNISLPKTWDDLLAAAKTIKAAGYVPFANASGDSWTIGTLLMQNWIPMLVGGKDGRVAYDSGAKCLNNADMVEAFQMAKDMAPYLPDGQAALTYYDSQQLWLQGKAVMWLGGSWDIPVFVDGKPDFQWSVMGIPPVQGKDSYMEFELDAGVGINSASKHIPEAKTFLTWLTTKQSAQLLADNLPGFYPMTKDNITIGNDYANSFLQLISAAKGSDIRFYMNAGTPDSTTLITDNAIAVIKGEMTPQDAAQKLYDGISSWNSAQKACKP